MSEIFLKECESNVKKIFKRKDGKPNSHLVSNVESTAAPVTRRSSSCKRSDEQAASSFTARARPRRETSCPTSTKISSTSSSESSPSSSSSGLPKYRSKNLIPRNIRNLFRRKLRATQGIFQTTSAKRCLALREKVDQIEAELKNYYSDRRSKIEADAVTKIKRNPKAFYAYAERFQKTKSGVGPLINEKDEIVNKPDGIAEKI